jgi:hypothetical protein
LCRAGGGTGVIGDIVDDGGGTVESEPSKKCEPRLLSYLRDRHVAAETVSKNAIGLGTRDTSIAIWVSTPMLEIGPLSDPVST